MFYLLISNIYLGKDQGCGHVAWLNLRHWISETLPSLKAKTHYISGQNEKDPSKEWKEEAVWPESISEGKPEVEWVVISLLAHACMIELQTIVLS